MRPVELWLRARGDAVPHALLASMIDALPEGDPPVPEALALGALGLYRSVASGSGGREDALPLLAADALFTHAFEAQAELDPAGIEALVSWCEVRLGEVAT